MKMVGGPRPREVKLFALIFIATGLWNLAQGLIDPDAARALLQGLTGKELSRDEMIVAVSARFTIVLIPVAAIWLFASRIARLLVAVMALAATPRLLGQWQLLQAGLELDRLLIASILVNLLGVAYLYTPPVRRWFTEGAYGPATAFE